MGSEGARRRLDLGAPDGEPKSQGAVQTGRRLALLVIREGLANLVKAAYKTLKLLLQGLAAALRAAWIHRGTLVTPIVRAPAQLYKLLTFLGGTRLGKFIIAAVTSILYVQLVWSPSRKGTGEARSAGGILGANLSLFFGAVKLSANVGIQLSLPEKPTFGTPAGGPTHGMAGPAAAAAGPTDSMGMPLRSSLLLQPGHVEREEIRLICSEDFEQHIVKFLTAQAQAAARQNPGACPSPATAGGSAAGATATGSASPAFQIFSPVKELHQLPKPSSSSSTLPLLHQSESPVISSSMHKDMEEAGKKPLAAGAGEAAGSSGAGSTKADGAASNEAAASTQMPLGLLASFLMPDPEGLSKFGKGLHAPGLDAGMHAAHIADDAALEAAAEQSDLHTAAMSSPQLAAMQQSPGAWQAGAAAGGGQAGSRAGRWQHGMAYSAQSPSALHDGPVEWLQQQRQQWWQTSGSPGR